MRAVRDRRPEHALGMAALPSLLACLLLPLAGCAFMRPARKPLSTHAFVAQGPAKAKGVLVMLPGYGDRPSDFENDDFVTRLASHAPGYDLIGVDLHFNYYRKGQALPRLEEVIEPLRAQGYREVWMLGVSLGGLGSVLYARAHPDEVSGMLLFAPYWGRGKVTADVASARSLCDWDPTGPGGELSEEDRAYLKNWRFLQKVGCEQPPPLPVWVGHGTDDPPSPAGQALVDRLPAEHHFEAPGGHGWKTWAALVDLMAPRVFADDAPAH